jgi:hypothetical protein
MIRSATEDKLVLNEEADNFDELPPFEESHYIQPQAADLAPGEQRNRVGQGDIGRPIAPGPAFAPAYYWYPPYGYLGNPVGYYGWPPMVTQRNIPEDTIPLKEGTDVMSSDDKHVGDVERLFIESGSNKVTHFVISQGLLFKDRKLVPAHWVRSVDEDKVHLVVASELLERLPSYND